MRDTKIAIFPGHVGKDSGAIDRVSEHERDDLMAIESGINFVVASLLKNKLDGMGLRNGIYIGSFDKRIEDSRPCGLGISLHCDAFRDNTVSGYTVFHFPGSINGRKFAAHVNYELSVFLKNIIKSRDVKGHNYYILSKTRFPVVLLEMGFLTNPGDEEKLMDYKIQNLIAYSLVGAIINYLGM